MTFGRIHREFADLPITTPETFRLPAERRAEMAPIVARACASLEVPSSLSISDIMIEGSNGAPSVRLRCYRPQSIRPLPAILYFHGGGFTVGSLDSAQAACVQFATEIGCIVYSVDYRLAPEAPFPAALEDGMTALRAITARAGEYGVDVDRLVVAGTSAGGAIAASVAIAARDEGGPQIRFQALSCPMLDDRLETHSAKKFTAVPIYSRFQAQASWEAYLGSRDPAEAPFAAPSRVVDLAGLPPAHIIAAELDPLRDEAIDYARRLLLAAVAVELHVVSGAPHGFDVVKPSAAVSRQATAMMIASIRDAVEGAVRAG